MAIDEPEIKTNGFNKKKIEGFLSEVDKIDDWSASEHGKISKKTLDKINDVRDAGEQIGIKKRVLNTLISEHRLRRKADAVRDDFADSIGTGNPAIIDQLDAVRLAAGLPLFDAAEVKVEVEKKRSHAKKPAIPLKPEFEDEGTASKPN